jgi:uncharacterized protein YebE (UPF0316 family)
MEAIIGGMLIFVARVVNVSMGTVRTLMSMRGQQKLATVISFFESLIFIVAISQVLQNVDNIWNILGYSSGFAVGTWTGLKIEERLALGYAEVQVITQSAGNELANALRDAGYGVTEVVGQGLRGQVRVLTVVANRRDVPAITELTSRIDEKAFVTVDGASRVHRGYIQGPS